MTKQIWFTQSGVRAYVPCSKRFGSCYKRQMMRTVRAGTKVCALPHNKPFEPTAGGCHAFRMRENRASSAMSLSLRERAIAPSSRLNGALCGLARERINCFVKKPGLSQITFSNAISFQAKSYQTIQILESICRGFLSKTDGKSLCLT